MPRPFSRLRFYDIDFSYYWHQPKAEYITMTISLPRKSENNKKIKVRKTEDILNEWI